MAEADPQEVRRWLADLATGSRLWIRSTVIAGTVAGVATVVQMVLLARIVHLGVIEKVPVAELAPLFASLILALLVRALAQGAQTRFAALSSERVRRDVRRQLHHHWQATGPVELAQFSAGTLAREWIDHVEALHGYFARFLPQMSLAVIVPLVILVLVFWLDWLAGLFLLASAPLIPLFMALVGMGAEKLNQQHFITISRLSGQFLDKVRGLTTLQLFGQTAWASELIRERSDQYRRVTMKTLRVAFLSSAVLEFFASVAIAVVAIYIGFGLLGYISFGPADELTLFSGLLVLLLAPEFFQPLRTLSQHYHDRAAALGASSEILARLASQPATGQPENAPAPVGNPERIELRAVHKSYRPEQPVLQNCNLTI
ncbi:MAG: ABC transporter transmembrane domain-containing protein, partial [Pseudomonadota bacterium]|nr:ABC transporter transmembrane domain-containing protein [Pseudomonadota bacterium]